MKKLSFTAVAVAAIIGTALLCTACPMDGQEAAEQFFTGSYGTYVWAANDLTLSSNETNFSAHFAGSGVHSVTLKKENVGSVDYLTSGEYYLDAKHIGNGVWSGIFYLNGKSFRTIEITLKSGNRCEIQPGLSVEDGIKFPENLKIEGTFMETPNSMTQTSSTGMPTYTKQFFAAVKSPSLKTQWKEKEIETFTGRSEDTKTVSGNTITTETWKGSPNLFINGTAANVYYKKITERDSSNNFVSGKFEIFIPKGTALPSDF